MSALTQAFCKRGHEMAITRRFARNGDTYCSECKKIRHNLYKEMYPEKRKAYIKTASLKKLYGITKEKYKELMVISGNKCMICQSSPTNKSLHVDHCHSTGILRGILCHGCNTALGLFRDDVSVLNSAIDYLNNPPLKAE